VYDADITAEEQAKVLRVNLVKETGWTFEYVDSLSLDEIGTFFAVVDGQNKIEKKHIRAQSKK
jgi:hypothetical protein